MLGPLAMLATGLCLATPVSPQRNEVRAGPFVGYLAAGYDDVGGRFSLRVGGMRTDSMSSKIFWRLPHDYDVPYGSPLVVAGRKFGFPARRFTQTFPGGRGKLQPDMDYGFPSIIKPPTVGCWRLTFAAGRVRGSLTMLARPPFRG
jgi:hypothetical protein